MLAQTSEQQYRLSMPGNRPYWARVGSRVINTVRAGTSCTAHSLGYSLVRTRQRSADWLNTGFASPTRRASGLNRAQRGEWVGGTESERNWSLHSGARLRFVSNTGDTQVIPLVAGKEQWTVGYDRACDVVLPPKHGVSRSHADIVRSTASSAGTARWAISDRFSTYGVFVNNRRVNQAVIEPGDVIRFADMECIFDADQVAVAPPVSTPTATLWNPIYTLAIGLGVAAGLLTFSGTLAVLLVVA